MFKLINSVQYIIPIYVLLHFPIAYTEIICYNLKPFVFGGEISGGKILEMMCDNLV